MMWETDWIVKINLFKNFHLQQNLHKKPYPRKKNVPDLEDW